MKKPMQTLSKEQVKLVSGGSLEQSRREDLENAMKNLDAAAFAKYLKRILGSGANINY